MMTLIKVAFVACQAAQRFSYLPRSAALSPSAEGEHAAPLCSARLQVRTLILNMQTHVIPVFIDVREQAQEAEKLFIAVIYDLMSLFMGKCLIIPYF